VTVTLDNNWDNKHAVSCCCFLKICCYRSRLVSIVLLTLTFHKVAYRHTWGVVGSLVKVITNFLLILKVKEFWKSV